MLFLHSLLITKQLVSRSIQVVGSCISAGTQLCRTCRLLYIMFGSPTASTPFGKFRSSAVGTASKSFGQQSATKRKRDEMLATTFDRSSGGYIKETSGGFESDGWIHCKLFAGGQTLAQRRVPTEETHFTANIMTQGTAKLRHYVDLFSEIDCGPGSNDSVDIVSCVRDGSIIMINVNSDGEQTSITCRLPLTHEHETITAICHAGNVAVIGTSAGDLYLVRRYGMTLNADLLQRQRGIFATILSSSARFMGISAAQSPDARIVKILPVPLSYLLFTVTANALCLWSDWTNPGEEKMLWEFDVRELIASDIAQMRVTPGGPVHLMDACLMHVQPGAEHATVLVLTTCPARSTAALWLHTLEVQMPTGYAGPETDTSSVVRILHRTLLAEEVEFASGEGHLAPKLMNQPPSWRVHVAWSAAHPEGSDPRDSQAVHSLHGVQIDVLNQPLLNATVSGAGSSAGRSAASQRRERLLESVRCAHAVDSGMLSTAVVAVNVVKGVDGICVVGTDGRVTSFSPPLAVRASMAIPQAAAAVRDRQQVARGAADQRVAVTVEIVLAAALEEGRGVKPAVLDALSSCNSAEAAEVMSVASSKLLSRAPTGEYWGANAAGGRAAALTAFQMVHRLVESKLNAHKRLLEIAAASGFSQQAAVLDALHQDHQRILFSAGLSGAAEECKLRITHSAMDGGEGAEDASFAVAVAQAALKILGQGMERAVVVGRSQSIESVEAQGLSVADVFYSEVSGIYRDVSDVVDCLATQQNALAGRRMVLAVTLQVASLVLSALQLAAVGEGALDPRTSCSCNVRASIARLIEMLRNAAQAERSAAAAGAGAKSDWASVVAVDKEGKRITELCVTALQSYAVEATFGENTGMEAMPQVWKGQYHHLKALCSELLLLLGHTQTAFTLCSEHAYCDGLMESTYREPQALLPRLEDTLRRIGGQCGTDSMPLATACFLWLEERNRPADILSLGLTDKPLLEAFLSTHPALAWMHHLRCQDYRAATIAASDCANDVTGISKATTLLSIAKLSAKLAADADKAPKVTKRLFAEARTPSGKKPSDEETAAFEASLQCTHASLAVLKAQTALADILPNAGLNREVRVNVSELVMLVTDALRYYGETTSSEAAPDLDHALAVDDPSSLVRAFGMGLGLLSMQLTMLDDLEKESPNRAVAAETVDGDIAANKAREAAATLAAQREKLSSLVTGLWSAAIAADKQTWLELASFPSLGAREEARIKTDCLLYQVVANAVSEVSAGQVREELVPAGGATAESDLLTKAMESSGVCDQRLSANGTAQQLPEGQTNSRVVHLLKVCVGSAMRNGEIPAQ